MNLTKEQEQKLNEAKTTWTAGEHHTGLMTLGWAYRRAGANVQEAIADAQALYTSIEDVKKHDDHMKEIEEAFSKVYDTSYSVKKSEQKADPESTMDIREWLNLQNLDTDILKEIKAQDESTTRIITKQAVLALYKNSSGRIRHGKSLETVRWTDSSEQYAGVYGGSDSKYMSTTVFGDLIDDEKQKDLTRLGRNIVAYDASERNILGKSIVFFEFDEPMGEPKIDKDDFRYMEDDKKQEYRRKVLEQTCLILDRAGLRPTCVVFSGNRSYHCLFRLDKPVDRAEWDKYERRLKSAYERIGADPQVVTYNRLTRIPKGVPHHAVADNAEQRVMFLDPNSEITLEAYTEALEKVADEIKPKTSCTQLTIPMEKTPDIKSGKEKWEFLPFKVEKSLKEVGIGVRYVRLDHKGNFELICTHDGGQYHPISAQGALDKLVKTYCSEDYAAGVMFREKVGEKFASERLTRYAGYAKDYHEPKDSTKKITLAYRNGLLEIIGSKTDNIVFHEGSYEGYDIRDDSPTINRDWQGIKDDRPCELEDFIDRACGREDNDPDWRSRKLALCSLLGYEMCGAKESVNFFPVIIEKSLDDNNGGTGKSLITKSLSFIHRTYFLDFKLWDDDQRFFFEGMAQSLPRVARCEDLPKSFDLEKMFNRITENFTADVKGKQAITLGMEDMPKFIATSNHYLRGTGNSYARRYKEFEITDYWRGKDPAKHYGHMLYYDWDEAEWARFDTFMTRCAYQYLMKGIVEFRGVNSVEKAIDVNLGELREFLDEKCENLPLITTANDLAGQYDEWYKSNHGRYPKISYTAKTMKAKAKVYCNLLGLSFYDNGGKTWSSNGESKRWLKIDRINPTTPEDDDKKDDKNDTEKYDGGSSYCSVIADYTTDFLSEAPDFDVENAKNDEKSNFRHTSVTQERHTCVISEVPQNQQVVKNMTEMTQDLYSKDEKMNKKNDQKGIEILCHTSSGSISESKTYPEPWWNFNGVKLAFDSEKGKTIVFCKGRIPEPIDGYYQILGSRYHASGLGVVDDEHAPIIEFRVVE